MKSKQQKERVAKVAASFEPISKEPIKRDEEIRITLTNNSDQALAIHPLWSRNPSLTLEIKDERGKRVLLPPPSVPSEKETELDSLVLDPQKALTISLPPFFDLAQPAGAYSVRYSYTASVIGSDEKIDIVSDWVEITLEEPTISPSPSPVPVGIWGAIKDFFSWWRCLIRRIICIFFPSPCDKDASIEVNEAVSETISNAPAGSEAWNGNYGWNARFTLALNQSECRITVTVKIRINGAITVAQRTAWENAIENKFSNTFKLCCKECGCACCPTGYTIVSDVQFVNNGEHQVVNIQPATTNMGNWGAADNVAVTHEFGHMLGAKDEYYTVDGVNWGNPWQAGVGVMNNPMRILWRVILI